MTWVRSESLIPGAEKQEVSIFRTLMMEKHSVSEPTVFLNRLTRKGAREHFVESFRRESLKVV